ncbi:FAD-dependent oxidoreductase [Marinithermus hydrothermalis]|uniref:CoA-disulfide reductase n=1 Tax=Marinithermus hydrothermalis (strain DSM 14884 / JCM 11576 / T1) TaxID=869210 RepID=F2NM13_MARHT|nr:FAD-dependent oxidoreductase [Marinithermus hydrothermalis]AEB11270.1 CoA-disulfide reductase [Marinithermus hydrothermalis DSM 14884]
MSRLVIIGGVAAGMSAAAKAKRTNPDLEITVFEKSPHVSYGACGLPYFLAGRIPRAEALIARTPEAFKQQGIAVLTRHEVTAVDLEGRRVQVHDHAEGRTFWHPFDHLLLATGATPIRPPIPGAHQEGVHVLRTLEDGLALHAALETARSTVIVGAGYIGLELAEAFRARGKAVTLIEAQPRVLPQADPEVSPLVEAELERHGVEVLTGTTVTAFTGQGRLEAVETSAGTVPADLAVLAVGVRPNVALAEAMGLELGPTGAVRVDAQLRTSHPGVWAAGDVAESRHRVTGEAYWLPLGDVANKHGRVAGSVIAGQPAAFAGVVGTTVTKVFELAVATTGLSEAAARSRGYPVATVWIQAKDRAHYYPDARPLYVKLIYRSDTGALLGGQLVGRGDAVLRVDALAALLHQGGTVEDLAALDLAYAPPFSPVWDPLLVAAGQAQKQRLPRRTGEGAPTREGA